MHRVTQTCHRHPMFYSFNNDFSSAHLGRRTCFVIEISDCWENRQEGVSVSPGTVCVLEDTGAVSWRSGIDSLSR